MINLSLAFLFRNLFNSNVVNIGLRLWSVFCLFVIVLTKMPSWMNLKFPSFHFQKAALVFWRNIRLGMWRTYWIGRLDNYLTAMKTISVNGQEFRIRCLSLIVGFHLKKLIVSLYRNFKFAKFDSSCEWVFWTNQSVKLYVLVLLSLSKKDCAWTDRNVQFLFETSWFANLIDKNIALNKRGMILTRYTEWMDYFGFGHLMYA